MLLELIFVFDLLASQPVQIIDDDPEPWLKPPGDGTAS